MKRTRYRNGDEISMKWNGCDGCNPASINGVLCHEAGCPDAWRDHKVECRECGYEFYPDSSGMVVCDGCSNDEAADMPDDEDEGDMEGNGGGVAYTDSEYLD